MATSTTTVVVKSKAVGKDLRYLMLILLQGPSYDDHDDWEFANYIFNELCSFGPGNCQYI